MSCFRRSQGPCHLLNFQHCLFQKRPLPPNSPANSYSIFPTTALAKASKTAVIWAAKGIVTMNLYYVIDSMSLGMGWGYNGMTTLRHKRPVEDYESGEWVWRRSYPWLYIDTVGKCIINIHLMKVCFVDMFKLNTPLARSVAFGISGQTPLRLVQIIKTCPDASKLVSCLWIRREMIGYAMI